MRRPRLLIACLLALAIAATLTQTASGAPLASGEVPRTAAAAGLRVMTYNIHWAAGYRKGTTVSGPVDISRVVADIRSSGATVVGLQEVNSYRLGDGSRYSQAHQIARELGWVSGGLDKHVLYHHNPPTSPLCEGQRQQIVARGAASCVAHGNALISQAPLRDKTWRSLSHRDGNSLFGPSAGRGLLRARITLGGRDVALYTTHLAREPGLAACQLKYMLRHYVQIRPAVVLGDFNMGTHQRVRSTPCEVGTRRPMSLLGRAGFREYRQPPQTYPAHLGARERIDHIYVSRGLRLSQITRFDNCTHMDDASRPWCSSDHMPLTAWLSIGRSRTDAPAGTRTPPVIQAPAPSGGGGLL